MKTKLFLTGFLFIATLFVNAQDKVKVSSLPKEANTFLGTYFKGQAIQDIFKVKDEKKYKYQATLQNGTEIEFTDRGRWKEVDGNKNTIPFDFLNEASVSYIKTNYPKQKVIEIEKGPRFIFVELDNNLKLQFEAEGKFYKIYEE